MIVSSLIVIDQTITFGFLPSVRLNMESTYVRAVIIIINIIIVVIVIIIIIVIINQGTPTYYF